MLYYQLQSTYPFCIIPTLPTIARTPLSLHKPNTHDVMMDDSIKEGEKEEVVEEGSVDTDVNPSQLFHTNSDDSYNNITNHDDSAHGDINVNGYNRNNQHHSDTYKNIKQSNRNCVNDSYELKVNKRRRRLQLWLQYISHSSFLVDSSPHLAEFLSGQSVLIPSRHGNRNRISSSSSFQLNQPTSSISNTVNHFPTDFSTTTSTNSKLQSHSPHLPSASASASFLSSLQSNFASLAQILQSPTKVMDLLSGKQRIIQAYLHSEYIYVNNQDSLALQLYSQLFHIYLNRMITTVTRRNSRVNNDTTSRDYDLYQPHTSSSNIVDTKRIDKDDDDDDEEYQEAASVTSTSSPDKTSSLATRALEAIGAIGTLGANTLLHGQMIMNSSGDTEYATECLHRPRLPHVLSEARSELLLQLLLRRKQMIDW